MKLDSGYLDGKLATELEPNVEPCVINITAPNRKLNLFVWEHVFSFSWSINVQQLSWLCCHFSVIVFFFFYHLWWILSMFYIIWMINFCSSTFKDAGKLNNLLLKILINHKEQSNCLPVSEFRKFRCLVRCHEDTLKYLTVSISAYHWAVWTVLIICNQYDYLIPGLLLSCKLGQSIYLKTGWLENPVWNL